jgi:hypothetical protein
VSSFDPTQLQQFWPRPSRPRPIVIIGAGGIVRDAHLPAYAKAGFPVTGVFDVNAKAAEERVREFNLPRVFRSMAEAASVTGAIFDVAGRTRVGARATAGRRNRRRAKADGPQPCRGATHR